MPLVETREVEVVLTSRHTDSGGRPDPKALEKALRGRLLGEFVIGHKKPRITYPTACQIIIEVPLGMSKADASSKLEQALRNQHLPRAREQLLAAGINVREIGGKPFSIDG